MTTITTQVTAHRAIKEILPKSLYKDYELMTESNPRSRDIFHRLILLTTELIPDPITGENSLFE